MKFPNPFLLGSGPPGTNARVIAKSYDAGWDDPRSVDVQSNTSPEILEVVSRNAERTFTTFADFKTDGLATAPPQPAS